MKTFKHVWRFALGAAIAALVSTAVLSCDTSGEDGEEVVILGNEVTGIEVTANRTVYGLNEVIDLTALVVTATFEDETVEPYAVTTAHLSPVAAIDTASASVPITVTVNGHAEVFNIAVFPVVSLNAGTYTGYANLDEAFENAENEDTITLYTDQTIKNNTNPSGKTVTLQGYVSAREITHSAGSAMFTLSETNTTLILGNKITLDGKKAANDVYPLVQVNSGAILIMEAGSTITGGNKTIGIDGGGGGVTVSEGGRFTMEGGAISENSSNSAGGGVYIFGGAFTMNDGAISENNSGEGGGVCVSANGSFTMEGGTISENSSANRGGGVGSFYNGTFTMNDGTISENEAKDGGGVYVIGSGGRFTMKDGAISGNSAIQNGGGVCVGGGTFTYNAGTITGNTAGTSGNAVFRYAFSTMNGGVTVTYANPDTVYETFPPE
jgi:hypothetical protein